MPSVILVTIDCLRVKHLSCYGYFRETTPFIDYLAKNGILFRKAYANGPFTLAAFPSILTSSYPLENGRYISLENRIFVSEVLKRNNVKTAAIHSNPYLSRVFGYDRGFDYFKDFFKPRVRRKRSKVMKVLSRIAHSYGPISRIISFLKKYYRLPCLPYASAETITKCAIEWLKRNYSDKFFLWLHYMDLHVPYLILNTNIERKFSKNLSRYQQVKILKPRRKYLQQIINVYDDKLRYIDFNLNRLYCFLEDVGIKDEVVIIITADHGEEFYEHGSFGHIAKFYEEIIHIPLIIYGCAEIVNSKLVSQIDLAPTILSLYGISPPERYRGVNLFSDRFREYVICEASHDEEGVYIQGFKIRKPIYASYSCVTKKWKYILYKGKIEELYDLENDPREKINVINNNPEIAEKLRGIIKSHIKMEERMKIRYRIRSLRRSMDQKFSFT